MLKEPSRRDLQDDHLNSLMPDVQVDRRGFVAACIAAGFAVSAGGGRRLEENARLVQETRRSMNKKGALGRLFCFPAWKISRRRRRLS